MVSAVQIVNSAQPEDVGPLTTLFMAQIGKQAPQPLPLP